MAPGPAEVDDGAGVRLILPEHNEFTPHQLGSFYPFYKPDRYRTGTEGMRTRDLQNGNSSIYRNTDSNENF